jgi:large subunit ribosomal protein L23
MVTEKSLEAMEKLNRYTFEVAREANKLEIAKAVEDAFDLKRKVLSVNTISRTGKYKRKGRKGGYRPDWKKAVITLVKGATIKSFEDS